MNLITEFESQVQRNIKNLESDHALREESLNWMISAGKSGNYTYNFRWLGRPIIQLPQDMVMMQELIWEVKPDLIIETGIAHGGSLIFNASMMAILDMCEKGGFNLPTGQEHLQRKVIGIDIDIRNHNRKAIEEHPLSARVQMIEGSSINPRIIAEVREIAKCYSRVMVCLDSNHTHDHVLVELESYAPLVSEGSYCVVYDTLIEDLPASFSENRSWGPGNNPKTAVRKFLESHDEFQIDTSIDSKLLISVAPGGYLKRIKN
jgi:cephalosporin hydroxylase